jgi:hypothetical protein
MYRQFAYGLGKMLSAFGTNDTDNLRAKIDYIFSDMSPDFAEFCEICVAKGKCNGACCYEQIKEYFI